MEANHENHFPREEILREVDRVLDERIAPRAAEIDRTGEFPDDVRRLFSSMGLLGLTVPPAFGGVEAPLDLVVDIVARIAEVCGNSANILIQQGLAIGPILYGGSEEQKRRWLPSMASGEALGSFGLTESDAGSDNSSLATRAHRDGDYYTLFGGKVFCTWGSIADIITIFAKTENDLDGDGFVALVLELPADGYEVVRLEEKMGLHGSPTAQLSFEDLKVPVENRLGEPGDGLRIAFASLDTGRVEVGAMALGLGNGALRYAGQHLLQREQFGRKLARFQGLQFKVAQHATELEASSLLLREAARAVEEKAPARTKLAAMAKMYTTDAAMRATTEAVQLLGGYGYLKDHPVERMMREAKLLQIVEGTNEIQRHVIAREWFLEIERRAGQR